MDFDGTKCKLFLIYVVMGLRVSILRFLIKLKQFLYIICQITYKYKIIIYNHFEEH